jgi:pimeloyl-ACP methyl ester carboxylesterase
MSIKRSSAAMTRAYSSDKRRGQLKIGAVIGAATATLGMAAWALAVRQKAKRAERNNPPSWRFLEIDGVRLHFLDYGEGDPVVILHGNGSLIQDFVGSGVVEALAERHRVIVFDRPGYGYSDRPRDKVWTASAQAKLLAHALRSLGVERPIIIGHSWGTLPAIELGLQDPAGIRGLVLLSGHYYPKLRLDAAMLSVPAIPGLGDVMRYTISPVLGRLLADRIIGKLFAPREVPTAFREAFPVEMALRPSQIRASAAESGLMIPVNNATQHRYAEIAMPVAIIAGAEDGIVNQKQSRRLHDDLPNSTLRIVPGAGHMIHYAVPHEVVGAVGEIATRSLIARCPSPVCQGEPVYG